MYRAKVAINSIKNKPMGSGWGSQGWVHSDILQIGASLGIITLIVFTMSQILLLVNIYKMLNKAPPQLKSSFFLCFSLNLGQLFSDLKHNSNNTLLEFFSHFSTEHLQSGHSQSGLLVVILQQVVGNP